MALAQALAGCGGHADREADGLDARAVVDATTASTAWFRATSESAPEADIDFTVAVAGETDFAAGDVHLRLTRQRMVPPPGVALESLWPAGFEVVAVDGTTYARSDDEPWHTDPASTSGLPLPAETLDEIAALSRTRTARVVGTEDVRGAPTVHYRYEEPGPDAAIDVWVYGERRVVRLRFVPATADPIAVPETGLLLMPGVTTFDLWDFGEPVDIAAPDQPPP